MKNSLENFIITVVFLVLALFSKTPLLIAILLLFSTKTVLKIGIRKYLKHFSIISIFVFSGALPLFIDLSSKSFFYPSKTGILVIFRSLASVSVIIYFLYTYNFMEIVSILSNIRGFTTLSEMILLTYSGISIFSKASEEMIIAQNSRLGYLNFKNTFRSLKYLFYGLFEKSLKTSFEYYDALLTRGYNGKIKILVCQNRLSLKRLVVYMVTIGILIFINWRF